MDPKLDALTKMVKSLTTEISKLKMEERLATTKNVSFDQPNRGQFRRPNVPQILQRERRDVDDQKVQPPFLNAIFEDEEGAERLDNVADINFLRDKEGLIHFT